jgi:phage repressor protein C with HTH and peptisase S24 domain
MLAGMNDSPKLSNMVAIAEAFGCSLDYLVNGTPDLGFNIRLEDDEIAFIKKFRELDDYGRDVAMYVVNREAQRINETRVVPKVIHTSSNTSNKRNSSEMRGALRSVLLYDLPVSAGTGVYLDSTTADKINIPDNEKTKSATFALRISGNSMEPRYHDGDILLVEQNDAPQMGQLGIFILDGSGYFKQYEGDRLVSLNSQYKDMLLKDYSEISYCGKVMGRLRKK